MNRQDMAEVAMVVGYTWPRERISLEQPVAGVPSEFDFWLGKLEHLEKVSVLAALEGFAQPFRPTWMEVRQRAEEIAGVARPTFAAAWAEVQGQIVSSSRKASWSHPAVGVFVKEMGWQRLTFSPDSGAVGYGPFLNDAAKVYEDCAKRADALEGAARVEALRLPEAALRDPHRLSEEARLEVAGRRPARLMPPEQVRAEAEAAERSRERARELVVQLADAKSLR